MNVPFKLVNTVRIDETPVHNAVREALVNCLVNADYFLPRGVVVESYPDRIIFKNPGTSIVGKRQMLKGGESEPRNVNIMKMFNLLGFGEHAGSGVPDIYSVWEDAGYLDPIIEEHFGEDGPSKMVVMLPLTEKENHHHPGGELGGDRRDKKNDTTDWENRKADVLALIKDNPHIATSTIAASLGLSRRQVERTLGLLKTDQVLFRQGSARSGQWVVKE